MTDDFPARFPRTAAVFEAGLGRQLHYGLQLSVSLQGTVVCDAALGTASADPEDRLTPQHVMLWLSAGKPLTAAAIVRAWEQGHFALDDPVKRLLPEFGAGGKDSVTVRHLLTHTGGFRTIDTGWPQAGWDEVLDRICRGAIETDWVPGRRAGYHVATSWFVLGEILRRIYGGSYAEVMRQQVFEPLGMSRTYAEIDASHAESLQLSPMFTRDGGALRDLEWHRPPRVAASSPGGNTRGSIRDLRRFYEVLLNRGRCAGGPSGEGQLREGQWLSPQAVEAMTVRHRTALHDETFQHVVDFGLGVILDSNLYGAETVPYGYGRYCSRRTFGHGGAQSSMGMCDPEAGLVIAFAFNGMPGEGQHNRRSRQLIEAIYEDLGLAGNSL